MAEVLQFKLPGDAEPRAMPQSIDCEQVVLGTILMSNHHYSRIADVTEDEHFFEPLHRQVWQCVRQLIEAGKVASLATIKVFLGNPDLGGKTLQEYLAAIAAEAGSVVQLVDHAKILRDLHIRRRLISLAMSLQDDCFNSKIESPISTLVDAFDEEMMQLRPTVKHGEREFVSFDEAAVWAVEEACEAFSHDGRLHGLSTGLSDVDAAIGGLQNSDLIIIAGRPGVGKTSLATNFAYNIARDLHASGRKGVVAFFSLEMSAKQLAQRIIAEKSEVAGWRIKQGKVQDSEIERYVMGAGDLRGLPLKIDDRGRPTIAQLTMRARVLQKKYGLALVVVDYLQLMRGSERMRDNRVQEVSEITAGLKALAKELDCPVVALSQLSRNVESRDDKRPQLSDLKDSGSIEQDADIVLFVYREFYYLQREEPTQGTDAHFEWSRKMENCHDRADLIVGKNRHGPILSIPLGWNAKLTQFHAAPLRDNLPDAREAKEEKEPRDKKGSSPKPESLALWGILRSMAISDRHAPTDSQMDADPNIKAETRLVSVIEARAKYRREILGPDTSEAVVATEFRRLAKDLITHGILAYTGTEEAPFVWLRKEK